MERLGSHWTAFHESLYWSIFRKSVEKNHVSLKSDNNNGYFTWRRYTFMIISRQILLKMRSVSDKSCRENKYTHFMFSDLFSENRAIYEITWKNYSRAGQATDDNMAHVRCMLDTKGYRHILWICNTLLFHCSSGCTNAPHRYVIRALPVF